MSAGKLGKVYENEMYYDKSERLIHVTFDQVGEVLTARYVQLLDASTYNSQNYYNCVIDGDMVYNHRRTITVREGEKIGWSAGDGFHCIPDAVPDTVSEEQRYPYYCPAIGGSGGSSGNHDKELKDMWWREHEKRAASSGNSSLTSYQQNYPSRTVG